MAESLLLPVVRVAAGKAGDALVKTVTRMYGIDGNRQKLERQLVAVQSKLADAEAKSETDGYVKLWMKALRSVAYEADNVLDDFRYEALRRDLQIGGSKTHKVLSHFTSHSPLLFRLTMSRKLSSVLEKINKLVEEANKFGLVENPAEAPQVLDRATHAALDRSAEIFGRDEDKKVVVDLLLAQQDQENVQVLPVFGMGGLGKTTLAKMVYNDPRVQQHFQLNMWHCVSENFEATAVVKSVIELATKERCKLDTIELLRGRLQEVIGQKRYLLVLDDVWNEEESKWEDSVKPFLCSVGAPGSVILVTCRSKKVASLMGTLGPHELACLSEDDSWQLFSKKAFGNGVEEQVELVSIGRRIVEKCRGLPLALKTMGGLMSSKRQVREWQDIENSNIGDNDRGKDGVLSILNLSYMHLTCEMKQCFAFCAIFPKDYEMEKDILIQLWMANGFLQEEVTMDLAQKGEFVFNYLVWRSFLQDVKVKKKIEYAYDGIPYEYGSTVCKMHDLMHDLAKHIADECATIEELVQQKASLEDVRHIQISYNEWGRSKSELEMSGLFRSTTSLCTFLLESAGHNKDLKELNMMSVRALRCRSSSITNSQIINAKHLRYLDLSWSGMDRLPDSVSMLYSLQTLKLNSCRNLKLLPEGISALRKLIHLNLLGCPCLEQMPPNISLLKNLRTLTTFIVGTEAGSGIEELKDLQHLGNRLELYNLRRIKSGSNAKEANLHQKKNVGELIMCWGLRRNDMPEDEVCNAEQVLESLAPHSALKILEVHGYGGVEIPQWMKDPEMFCFLTELTISNCPRCKDVPMVWLSDSLEYLCAANMGSVTTLCKSYTDVEAEGYNTPLQTFPKLKKMILRELPRLERWTESVAPEPNSLLVMFPVLEELQIRKCPTLGSFPGSPLLKKLTIVECQSLPISPLAPLIKLTEFEYEGTGFVPTSMPLCCWPSLVKLRLSSVENMMMELWERFSFVEELIICDCNKLVRWPVEELQSLPRLRSLEINGCENLGSSSSEEETLPPLPHLERISIFNCGSLIKIPKLPASLRLLDIGGCEGLKALADGMDGLTSLERLSIQYCPGIEEFPQGLLQRLPALKSLWVEGCPDLEKRCREGGEYFHLLSSIPQVIIAKTEKGTGSCVNKLVKRLLPSCVDSV